MHKVVYVQAYVSGLLATEFGPSPSGAVVSPSLAFGFDAGGQLRRTVHIRNDAALAGWTDYFEDARRGLHEAVAYQLKNPAYLKKLREAGIDPKLVMPSSFRLSYGSGLSTIADPDLEALATLARENFVRSEDEFQGLPR
jgi:hypothetical protein